MISTNELYLNDLKKVFEIGLQVSGLKQKNVLVTGGLGLIGSCLVDVLMILEANVFVIGRDEEKAKSRFCNYFNKENFKFIAHDVVNKLELDCNIDYIIHAASNAHPKAFINDPVGTMNSNYIGTYNLLEFGRTHGLKRFLYVSSGEVYGSGDIDKFSEDYLGYVDLLNIRSSYPISKRASETLCVSYSKQFGVDTVIVRPCHVYGPTCTEKDTRVLTAFIRNAVNNEDIILKSSGKQVRTNCYVVDAVFALLHVLLLGNRGEAYNISDMGSNMSIRELANVISENACISVKVENKEEDGRLRAVLDDTKIKSLGWEPIYTLKDGIDRTIKILKMES